MARFCFANACGPTCALFPFNRFRCRHANHIAESFSLRCISITVDHPQCCRHRRRRCQTFSLSPFSSARTVGEFRKDAIIIISGSTFLFTRHQIAYFAKQLLSVRLRRAHMLCVSAQCVIHFERAFWPSSSIFEIFRPLFITHNPFHLHRGLLFEPYSVQNAPLFLRKEMNFSLKNWLNFKKKSRESSNTIACLVFEILCTLFPSLNTWNLFEYAAFQPICIFNMKNRLILWQTRAVLTHFTQAATAYECQK